MAKFLSPDWFDQVTQLTDKAGDLNLPPAVKNLSLNLNVSGLQDQPVNASFHGGTIHQGSKADALTTLSLDAETLKAVFLERNMNRAMQAFMDGKLRVEGDMGQLMAIQTTNPSSEQRQLFKDILAMTEM